MKKSMNLRRLSALFLTLVLSLSAMVVPGSAASREVLPDGSYIIYTESLSTCLNVQYAAKNGGKVVTDAAGINATVGTALESNEIWVLDNVDRGYVTLTPKNAPNCYLSGENGFDRQLIIRKCVPSEAICQWLPIQVENGAYVFQNRATGYVIDVRCGENTKSGTPLLQYTRNGYTAAQSLYPVRISHFSSLTPSNRVTNLVSCSYKAGLYYDRTRSGTPSTASSLAPVWCVIPTTVRPTRSFISKMRATAFTACASPATPATALPPGTCSWIPRWSFSATTGLSAASTKFTR